MAPGAADGHVEPQNHPEQGHGIHPVLPGLCRRGILPTDLEYGSPKVMNYDEGTN
jgi:hypothetical protein